MKNKTSVFDDPKTKKEFHNHLEERQRRREARLNMKEERIYGDNSSEQIINKTSELL